VTKILLKSTSKCLLDDMLITFFGYVVVNNSIMEDCFPNMKWHRKQIKFYENCIFYEFLLDLIHQLQKFKSLRICLHFLWKKFCWKVLAMAYRMIYGLYFLDSLSQIFSSLKVTCFDYKLIELWLLWKYDQISRILLNFANITTTSNVKSFATKNLIEMIESALERSNVTLYDAYKMILRNIFTLSESLSEVYGLHW